MDSYANKEEEAEDLTLLSSKSESGSSPPPPSPSTPLATPSLNAAPRKATRWTTTCAVIAAIALLVVLAAIAVPVTLSLRGTNTTTASAASVASVGAPMAALPMPAAPASPSTASNLPPTVVVAPTSTNSNSAAAPTAVAPTAAAPTAPAPTTITSTTTTNGTTSGTTSTTPGEPTLGMAANTAYLHCTSAMTTASITHHVVLLHGASFTKEIWTKLDILEQFCARPTIAVTALDLSFGTYGQLQNILQDLQTKVSSDATVVLVTPSAGGSSVVDWLINGDAAVLRQHVDVWVPVAVGSLSTASDNQVTAIVPLSILAIYGDGDVSGGRTSQRLARLAGAEVVELVGGHPVYRDSPDEFVATILDFLNLS